MLLVATFKGDIGLPVQRVIEIGGRMVQRIGEVGLIAVADGLNEVIFCAHIVGTVAAMTESDPDVVSEKAYTTSLVNRDSATRRARHLAVQFDVGKLSHRS